MPYLVSLIATTVGISLVLLLTLSSCGATLCQLDDVRDLANRQLLGGWSKAEASDPGVVKLMKSAAVQAQTTSKVDGTGNGIRQARDDHVIESFSQIVSGVNYCIVFSLAGECHGFHCKSYECRTSGHQPLSSQEIIIDGVDCEEQHVCDIARTRQLALNPRPGGWYNASLDNDKVRQLHASAASIAAVDRGTLAEAYKQVVAGFNYCIRFDTRMQGNCGANDCAALTCVAGAFHPLPHMTSNPDALTRIGVECKPGEGYAHGHLVGSSPSSAAILSGAMMTTTLSIMAAMILS